MRTVLATLSLIGLLAAGCGKSGGDLGKQYEEWANAVCACKDQECANKANEKGMKMMQEAAGKVTDADEAKKAAELAQTAAKKATECLTKLATAG